MNIYSLQTGDECMSESLGFYSTRDKAEKARATLLAEGEVTTDDVWIEVIEIDKERI